MENLEHVEDDRMEDSIEDVFLQDDLCPTIAEHARQCHSLFNKYIIMAEMVPDPTIMDDQLARFTLWASNMDVYGPANVSLDYRLRFSPTVVEIIHQLLDVICDALTSLKSINDTPQTPSRKRQRISGGNLQATWRADDDASESDSEEDQANKNISKITDTIGGTVTRLFRLSNAVRKSAKANRARKIERYKGDEETNNAIAELRLYTDCYIRYRFPMASDPLRLALVEANALRLRRLCYQRSHRRRIDLNTQYPQPIPTTVQMPKIKKTSPAVRFAPSVLSKPATVDKALRPVGPRPVPATNATTARQTAAEALYAKSTTEVSRAKSMLVNNKLSFPPGPSTSQCPYCSVILEFKSTAKVMWHDHVIRDLEPFICVSTHCLEADIHGTGPLTFETSKAWISHIQNAHGHVWECRASCHDPITFDQEMQYQEHSIKEHGVPATHAATLSDAARRPVLDKVIECPFGDDFQPPEKVESSAVFSSEALQSHVATHMKEVALLTLQKLPSDSDEAVDNIDSDQLLEDDGPGFAKRRESMDSILDNEALDFHDDYQAAANDISDPDKEDLGPLVRELDLEDKDDSGMTQLHHAVKADNVPLAKSLIHGGAHLDNTDNSGRTALHYACMTQSRYINWDMMTVLLNAGGETIINLRDNYGQTALHYAVERGLTDAMAMLVRQGVDTSIKDNYGFSPFLWAVVAGRGSAAEKLLQRGADIDSTSADGKSALTWAAGLGWYSIVFTLIKNGATVQMAPLVVSATSSDSNMVKTLFKSRSSVRINHRDRDGWSAIHWAAEEGRLETVDLLLKRRAKVNAVSFYGTSALHCAANGGHISIVSLLLEHGANAAMLTCHGWTALHHAAFMGHSHVVKRLLADERLRSIASHQDNHGWSALHLAVHSRDMATVNAILDSAVIAEPHALVDDSGLTAEEWLDLAPTSHSYKATSSLAFSKSRCCRAVTGLREAVVHGNVPMIKLALKLGYSVNETNSGTRTALYYATRKNTLFIMNLLLDRGADPNILPAGRKTWEEFISNGQILLRLEQAGYRKRYNNPEVEHQIRLALRAKYQPDYYSMQQNPRAY
ncbi:hypothetical protein CDD82_3356 [Ophiocordyceps australis]|uniref:Uncharacterized protein n=1 Tax=Ophiocordyceps australis TaxID=1399860 RepID=A0A2C5XQ18_9HYPO|nr:hypothetical protein CDD82_3356 [Ophiocordyceps australis]